MQRLAVGLLGLGAVLATGHAIANDTMSQLGAGGLEFVTTDKVEMAAEDLSISPTEVKVVYTFKNDASEDQGVLAVFGDATPCSSTKGWTGHTLGAAAITEAVISLMCLGGGFLPRSLNTRSKDPQLRSNILLSAREGRLDHVLSKSFGFGGSNCSLLFGTPS